MTTAWDKVRFYKRRVLHHDEIATSCPNRALLVYHRGQGRVLEYSGEEVCAYVDQAGVADVSDFQHNEGPITDGVYVWEGSVNHFEVENTIEHGMDFDTEMVGYLRDLTDEEMVLFANGEELVSLWDTEVEAAADDWECERCGKTRGEHFPVDVFLLPGTRLLNEDNEFLCEDPSNTIHPVLQAFLTGCNTFEVRSVPDPLWHSADLHIDTWIKNSIAYLLRRVVPLMVSIDGFEAGEMTVQDTASWIAQRAEDVIERFNWSEDLEELAGTLQAVAMTAPEGCRTEMLLGVVGDLLCLWQGGIRGDEEAYLQVGSKMAWALSLTASAFEQLGEEIVAEIVAKAQPERPNLRLA